MEFSALQAFADYEPDISKPKKTSLQKADSNQTSFRKVATTHKIFSLSEWGLKIFKELELGAGHCIVRITRVNIPEEGAVFIFSEYNEIISSMAIQNFFQNDSIYLSRLNDVDFKVVTLFDVVQYPINASEPGTILRSISFSHMRAEPPPTLVVQYSLGSTICMTHDNLFDILLTQYKVTSFDISQWTAPETVRPSRMPRLLSSRDLESILSPVYRRLDDMEDYIYTLSSAYERGRRMAKAVFDVAHKEQEHGNEGLNDVKERIGHIREEVIRHAISMAYGYDWGTSVNIGGFTDAVSFVSNGLGKSPMERDEGKACLMKRFCKGLQNLNLDIPEMKDKRNSDKFAAEQKKLEKSYSEACPYGRLVFWMKAASKADNVSRSKFLNHMRAYLAVFEDHKRTFAVQKDISAETFVPRLLEQDDELSMMLLWFLIDPSTYNPNLTISLLKWPIPTVNLEFGHRGCWKEISSSHYFYEGGESKGSYDNYQDAKIQLLRRFAMIDAIATYSFHSPIYFKGIVFVPSIPPNAIIEERVPLPWKLQPSSKDTENKDESFTSEDVRNLTPDIYSCIIRVSVAPTCLMDHGT